MKNGWYKDMFGNLLHYVNDKTHNQKLPAYIWDNGNKYWFQNNNLHRIDGPACEYFNRSKLWYYQGEIINCQSQQEFERLIKLKLFW